MGFDGLSINSIDEAISELKNIGFNDSEAEEVAYILEEEAEEDTENAKSLLENLRNDAEAFISQLGLETFSFVGNPSQPSKFVMMKDGDEKFKSSSPILKNKELDDEFEVIYAPVMQPSAVDKDGEVIPSKIIKESAHDFLASGKTDQIDENHELITGKGELVESWILKEDKTYSLPDSYEDEEFTVEKGSWMVGVKPSDESKEKIRSGEFTGFSIFGEAEKIELRNSFKTKDHESNSIEDKSMPEDENDEDEYGLKDVAEGVESLKDELSDLSEQVTEIKEDSESSVKEVSTVDELKNALDGDEPVSLELEADDLPVKEESKGEDGETEKGEMEDAVERLADMVDMPMQDIIDALGLEANGEDEDEDKEAKGKGSNGEGLRKSTLDDSTEKSGELSFQDAARKSVEEA